MRRSFWKEPKVVEERRVVWVITMEMTISQISTWDAFGLGGFLKRYRDKLPELDLTTTKVLPIFMILWQPIWHGIRGPHNHNQICLTDSSNIIPLNPIILTSHSVYHVPWISHPFLPPDFWFSYFPSLLLHSNIKFHPSLEALFHQLLLLPQLWSTPPASHLPFS